MELAIRSTNATILRRLLKTKQNQPGKRLAYLPKLKAWKVLLKLVFRLPSRMLIQRN
jgi:hypothetical protein